MKHFLKYKLIGMPVIIWMLQLLYVAVALGLFIVLLAVLNTQASRLLIQILYVLVMLVINIKWRLAIKKKRPEWF
jgi:membrane protein DedA with SNARE-associated domain